MSTTAVTYLYSTVVILHLVWLEKAVYEAKSVKQSHSECETLFYAKFIGPNRDSCVTISSV